MKEVWNTRDIGNTLSKDIGYSSEVYCLVFWVKVWLLGRLRWFENDGQGRFKNHLVTTDQEAYDIRAFDMDLDGDLDLLIGGRNSNNVVWCENPRF